MARSKETRIHSVVSDKHPAAGCHTAGLARSDYATGVFRPARRPDDRQADTWHRSIRPRLFPHCILRIGGSRYRRTAAQTIAEKDVPPDALEATMGNQLRSEGFDGAAIVMLGGPGGGSTSQLSNFAWSRFCMSDNLGAWVGEILHQTNLCDLPDLFDWGGNMGPFDQEAGYLATHLSGWTKRAVGWLDPSTVALHLGQAAEYTLHSISLIQPPPTGRIAAVQIGAQVPYLMVEARLQADQFDINIPNEGVIVYRVQTTDPLGNAQNDTAPLVLLTKAALTAGQSFTTDGVTVQVGNSVPGGFSVQVSTSSPLGIVPDVFELTANVASKMITKAGFVPKFSTKSGLWVSSQSPTGGSAAPLGSTVTMTMHSGPMP